MSATPTYSASSTTAKKCFLTWRCGALKVERTLPITVDAVNDQPKVVIPHHHVVKIGSFGVWSRYLATQTGVSTRNGTITVRILTDAASGLVALRGIDDDTITSQVRPVGGVTRLDLCLGLSILSIP